VSGNFGSAPSLDQAKLGRNVDRCRYAGRYVYCTNAYSSGHTEFGLSNKGVDKAILATGISHFGNVPCTGNREANDMVDTSLG
jgi:hypothetical protein